MKPVLCMITDRRRLGAGADDVLVRRVAAAARAGVHLVQIRERDLDGGPLVRLVARCVGTVASTRTRILVNDRVDVALAAGAHGVHLRGDSMAAARVRRAAPAGFLIGRSIHSAEEAAQIGAEGAADYLVFGPVCATPSKPGQPPAGLGALREVVSATALPVLAVGGVTPETAAGMREAGAAGVAAIGLFADIDDERLQIVVETLNRAFDTLDGVP